MLKRFSFLHRHLIHKVLQFPGHLLHKYHFLHIGIADQLYLAGVVPICIHPDFVRPSQESQFLIIINTKQNSSAEHQLFHGLFRLFTQQLSFILCV